MTKSTRAPKAITFSAFVVQYAQAHDMTDTTKAAKRLRSKIRNAHGKDDAVTKWIANANKENKDGNRYPDVTPTVAKALTSL
jgi:hypothetical protein